MPERPLHSPLLTDLYELTMAAVYFENKFEALASFELFARHLPPGRSFLLAAGLEQALEFLENFRFSAEDVDFLRRHPAFAHVSDGFFEHLRALRFTGEVWAMPEGTLAFAEEPLVRVTAPVIEAQIVETFLLTTLTFQTLIATKAARVVQAAAGRGVVEFGSRRAHGPESGVLAARAAYIGGCMGTSNVEAGMRYGIPTFGTMAHSFLMAFGDEGESFRAFQRVFPEHAVLLVDTYDTLAAIDKIVHMGLRPRGVRLDSGNLVELSKDVRRKLDAAGLTDTQIFASGDLNELAISAALAAGAVVESFGVGTALATSKDAPALSGVYKLVELEVGGERKYCAKFSPEKATYPGTKQVFRFRNQKGEYDRDVIGRSGERYAEAEELLVCVMRDGRWTQPPPALDAVRAHAREQLARLPMGYRELQNAAQFPVEISSKLKALQEEVRNQLMQPAGTTGTRGKG